MAVFRRGGGRYRPVARGDIHNNPIFPGHGGPSKEDENGGGRSLPRRPRRERPSGTAGRPADAQRAGGPLVPEAGAAGVFPIRTGEEKNTGITSALGGGGTGVLPAAAQRSALSHIL